MYPYVFIGWIHFSLTQWQSIEWNDCWTFDVNTFRIHWIREWKVDLNWTFGWVVIIWRLNIVWVRLLGMPSFWCLRSSSSQIKKITYSIFKLDRYYFNLLILFNLMLMRFFSRFSDISFSNNQNYFPPQTSSPVVCILCILYLIFNFLPI